MSPKSPYIVANTAGVQRQLSGIEQACIQRSHQSQFLDMDTGTNVFLYVNESIDFLSFQGLFVSPSNQIEAKKVSANQRRPQSFNLKTNINLLKNW